LENRAKTPSGIALIEEIFAPRDDPNVPAYWGEKTSAQISPWRNSVDVGCK